MKSIVVGFNYSVTFKFKKTESIRADIISQTNLQMEIMINLNIRFIVMLAVR